MKNIHQESTSSRLIAIGDIHGHAVALAALLDLITPQPEDVIVTLGDYIDRGPDSKGVIDLLLELQQQCQLISIMGNHEEMLLDARNNPNVEQSWRYHGGTEALHSYGSNSLTDIPQQHWDFLESCLPYYETEQCVFTHANYCWYLPMDQQTVNDLRWMSLEESPPRAHLNGKTFILGHTPGEIRNYGYCLCLDTGCGFGGTLTAMEIKSKKVWQFLEAGLRTENM